MVHSSTCTCSEQFVKCFVLQHMLLKLFYYWGTVLEGFVIFFSFRHPFNIFSLCLVMLSFLFLVDCSVKLSFLPYSVFAAFLCVTPVEHCYCRDHMTSWEVQLTWVLPLTTMSGLLLLAWKSQPRDAYAVNVWGRKGGLHVLTHCAFWQRSEEQNLRVSNRWTQSGWQEVMQINTTVYYLERENCSDRMMIMIKYNNDEAELGNYGGWWYWVRISAYLV